MKLIDSVLQSVSRVFSMKTKSHVGLSFNDEVRLKQLPASPLMRVGKFIHFNKDLVKPHFEVTMVNHIDRRVKVCEICTANEFELDFDLFEYLFQETPVPDECKL